MTAARSISRDAKYAGCFLLGNVDVASNLFNVLRSNSESADQTVPPLLKRVFCAKRKVTFKLTCPSR